MNILLRSARIIDPQGNHHGTTADILIKNGIIEAIESSVDPGNDTTVVEFPGLHVSPGWFDSSVCFGEPGFEERETIKNGLLTAGRSGFTAVGVNPNTYPVADSNADMSFMISRGAGAATELFPVGALTAKGEGVDLAELFDMKQAGAIAFGDYKAPIKNPNLLKIALQYTQNFDGLVISFPLETSISGKGVVNEEAVALRLGLKGIPALSEELQIARDLFILEYAGGKLHIPTISTAKAVELIAEAKKKGLDVSCSVSVHHLFLTDEVLDGFDTRYKVLPPLRTDKDRQALVQGVKDGIIDMVTSDHDPRDIEHKKVEFDHADYGTIGLESAFGALNKVLGTDQAVAMLTAGRKRFDLKVPQIAVGETANLSLFDPEADVTFEKDRVLSASANSAFFNQQLKGQVFGIIRGTQMEIKS